jgi:hypothetical protein
MKMTDGRLAFKGDVLRCHSETQPKNLSIELTVE